MNTMNHNSNPNMRHYQQQPGTEGLPPISAGSYFLQQPYHHQPPQHQHSQHSQPLPQHQVQYHQQPQQTQPQRRRIWIRHQQEQTATSKAHTTSQKPIVTPQPTSILISRDTIVDDLKSQILTKYSNTIGKHFDSFQISIKLEVPLREEEEQVRERLQSSGIVTAGISINTNIANNNATAAAAASRSRGSPFSVLSPSSPRTLTPSYASTLKATNSPNSATAPNSATTATATTTNQPATTTPATTAANVTQPVITTATTGNPTNTGVKNKPVLSTAFANSLNSNYISPTGSITAEARSPLSPMPISSQKSSLINLDSLGQPHGNLQRQKSATAKKTLLTLQPDQNIWEVIDTYFPELASVSINVSVQQLSMDFCFIAETPAIPEPAPIQPVVQPVIEQVVRRISYNGLNSAVIPEYDEEDELQNQQGSNSAQFGDLTPTPFHSSQGKQGHLRRYHSISTTDQYYKQSDTTTPPPLSASASASASTFASQNQSNHTRRSVTPASSMNQRSNLHTGGMHRRSQSANPHFSHPQSMNSNVNFSNVNTSNVSTTPTPTHTSSNTPAKSFRPPSALGGNKTTRSESSTGYASPSSVLLLPAADDSSGIPGSWKGSVQLGSNSGSGGYSRSMISPLIESPETEFPLSATSATLKDREAEKDINSSVETLRPNSTPVDPSSTTTPQQQQQQQQQQPSGNTSGQRHPSIPLSRSLSESNNASTTSLAAPNTLSKILPSISVLIVEDNQINLRILSAHLRRHKIHHDTAKNGQEAIDKWRQGGFHLILMDIQLPVLSGLEASMEIRRLERVNGVGGARDESVRIEDIDKLDMSSSFKSPVIIVALTASNLKQDKTEALASGCNDYLTKPVNFEWLLNKITEWGCMQALIDFDGWAFGKGRIISTNVEIGKGNSVRPSIVSG